MFEQDNTAIPLISCNFFLFTGKIDEIQMGLLFLRIVQLFLLVYREKMLTIESGLLFFEHNSLISR